MTPLWLVSTRSGKLLWGSFVFSVDAHLFTHTRNIGHLYISLGASTEDRIAETWRSRSVHHCGVPLLCNHFNFNPVNVCCSQSLEETLALWLFSIRLSQCAACLSLIAMNWSLRLCLLFQQRSSLGQVYFLRPGDFFPSGWDSRRVPPFLCVSGISYTPALFFLFAHWL